MALLDDIIASLEEEDDKENDNGKGKGKADPPDGKQDKEDGHGKDNGNNRTFVYCDKFYEEFGISK